MTPTLRDALYASVPTWLQGTYGFRFLYSIALQLDALLDALIAGIKLRFPGLYSFESLPYVGRERRIRRGREESDENYSTRLLRWREDHKTRGNAYALLAQLYAHYAPSNFVIQLVYKSGRRFTMAVDGTITVDYVAPSAPQAQWARWTLFYFTEEWPTPETVTPDDKNDLTMIPKEWIAGHVIGKLVLMPTGVELWNYHVPPMQWNNHSLWNKAPGTVLPI